MNGMFLIVAGLFWDRLALSARALSGAYGLLLWAGYANWLACVLGAAFGASRMTPIAGGAFTALPWQENVVAALFGSVGVTMVAAVVLMAWGLKPGRAR